MRRLLASALLLVLLAGCAEDAAPDDPPMGPPDEPMPATHVLVGAVEPADLTAPAFRLLGAVAAGGPAYGAGEPGIHAALDGTIFVTFPGCDDGPYYLGPSLPGSETCGHGLVFRSTDDGATWTRLNRAGDGRLTDDGPAANGDADLAVDSAGNVYASNLGGGIQFLASEDGGTSWSYRANIVPLTDDPDDGAEAREGADRQWLAAAGPGHVINAWMRTFPERDVELNTTFDGGLTWTGRANFGDGIGWLGTVQFAPDGQHAYVPYTQPTTGNNFEMHVLRTANGGRSWDDVATGLTWETTSTSAQWSGGHMAPALDVTGDGTVVVAMAIDTWAASPGAGAATTAQGTAIVYRTSRDDGRTWSETAGLSAPGATPEALGASTRVFPWITGGAGDRFAITYFTNPLPVDTNTLGSIWALEATVCDGVAEGQPACVTSVVDDHVHEGPICTTGGGCNGPVDRALLDYFESDLTPDGRLVIVYPADPVQANKQIEIRVAIQEGGSPLLQRAT